MKHEIPRFVIGDQNPSVYSSLLSKYKYVDLTNKEKLQVFVELACYGSEPDDFVFLDPSDQENRGEADAWFNRELTFLSKRDARELRDVWESVAENGDGSRLLFTAVRILQDKY